MNNFSYFVGIDVSKDFFSFVVINNETEILKEDSLAMDFESFQKFKSILELYPNSVIALESTGCYHINLISFLLSFKKEVCLINPSLIKRFSQSFSLRNTKTDEIDALIIAKFILKNIDNVSYFTPDNYDDISTLAKVRENLSKQVARVKNQLKQHLTIVFPELNARFNVFSDTILSILEVFPTPESIRKAPKSKIISLFSKFHNRKVDISPQKLIELANNSIGRSSDGFVKVISCDVKMLKFLNEQLEEITNEFINKINSSKKDEMEILTSIKGISNTTAGHFLAVVKDISRFENRNKLSAYAGIDPSFKQSGKSIFAKGPVSKKGSKSLRRCLYLMANSVMKFNEHFKNYYIKKREQGMPHRKAMIALCNKLVRILFAMLSKKEVFHMPSFN